MRLSLDLSLLVALSEGKTMCFLGEVSVPGINLWSGTRGSTSTQQRLFDEAQAQW